MTPPAKPEMTLAQIVSGAKVIGLSLQAVGVALGIAGVYLHFHFYRETEALERTAPDLVVSVLLAHRAYIGASGIALFLAGFCLLSVGLAFRWVALSASARSAHAHPSAPSSPGPSGSAESTGA